jgi:hypothetical protein
MRGPHSLLHVKEGACLLMGDSRARLVSFPSFKGGGWPSCCWGTGGLVPFLPTAGGLPAAGELVGLSLFPSFKGGVAFLLLGNWWACPFSSNCRWPSCCRGTGGLVPFRPFSSDSRWPSCCWGTGGLVPFLPTAGGLPAAGELVGLSRFFQGGRRNNAGLLPSSLLPRVKGQPGKAYGFDRRGGELAAAGIGRAETWQPCRSDMAPALMELCL